MCFSHLGVFLTLTDTPVSIQICLSRGYRFCHNFFVVQLVWQPAHFWKGSIFCHKKIRKRNKMLTKITLEVARSKNVLVYLQPSNKLWARILQNFQLVYACTFFCCYAFPKPFATIWRCTSMFAWSGMRPFWPTGEYVVLHIFKYAVSVKG